MELELGWANDLEVTLWLRSWIFLYSWVLGIHEEEPTWTTSYDASLLRRSFSVPNSATSAVDAGHALRYRSQPYPVSIAKWEDSV